MNAYLTLNMKKILLILINLYLKIFYYAYRTIEISYTYILLLFALFIAIINSIIEFMFPDLYNNEMFYNYIQKLIILNKRNLNED